MQEQCLGWVFVCFDIHVMAHGCVWASACRARDSPEVKIARPVLHRHPIFVTDGTTVSGTKPISVAGHRISLF